MKFGHFRFFWWTKTTSKIKNSQKTNTTPTKWKATSNWRKKIKQTVWSNESANKKTIRKKSHLKRNKKTHTENMNRIREYRQKSVCTWTAFVINFLLIINLSQNVFGKFLSPHLFFLHSFYFWSEFIASKRFYLFVVFHLKTHIEWEWENEKRRQNDKRPEFVVYSFICSSPFS